MRLITGIALSLLLAGTTACGGSDEGPKVATAGGTPTTSASAQAEEGSPTAYAACMRENGIPMDDPKTDAEGHTRFELKIPEGMDKAKVDAAQEKCRSLLPNGGDMSQNDPEQREKMLEMSRCMRDNGYPKFPDPNADGGINITPDMGIEPDDPAFEAAQKKCQPSDAGPRLESEN
ncbi:hypothetical protein EDD29_8517 [Actinocorallia herbida]|uniref:Subtilisin inhibitor-like n=1 Tax=Actinocorallia herbida TaxID=58109 RepID=A0A3N1DCC9_9ACTN|nr:hypothetical protein [Actinocorallia herbida]ROO90778.1 hypothetical protein EDD29_8517 [Actinocorallia herbida]